MSCLHPVLATDPIPGRPGWVRYRCLADGCGHVDEFKPFVPTSRMVLERRLRQAKLCLKNAREEAETWQESAALAEDAVQGLERELNALEDTP